MMDSRALRLDLLCAARDDIRGTYDTYTEQINTLMILTAFVLPFALGIVQLSDQYVPQTEESCIENEVVPCFEVANPWIVYMWSYIVAVTLILPFWGLLLLLQCKVKLDNWLKFSMDSLQELRREVLTVQNPASPGLGNSEVARTLPGGVSRAESKRKEAIADEQEQTIARVGDFILACQDSFAEVWSRECTPAVFWATRLLWGSVSMAVALAGLMYWWFMKNRHGHLDSLHVHAGIWLFLGLFAPVGVVCLKPHFGRLSFYKNRLNDDSPQSTSTPQSPFRRQSMGSGVPRSDFDSPGSAPLLQR